MAKKKTATTGPVNVGFAGTYKGCQVVANIMGLNVETVRKRAKAGKIPAALVDGTWTFEHDRLVAAGIQPFASNPIGAPVPNLCGTGHPLLPPTPPPVVKVNRTHVIFVLDRSGSMAGLMEQARRNLEQQLQTLRASTSPTNVFRASFINFDDHIFQTLTGTNVMSIAEGQAAFLYKDAGGSTKLYDAVLNAIDLAASSAVDPEEAVLVSVVTDGQENASSTTQFTLAGRVKTAAASGKYTFAYAGPRGSERTAFAIGIPVGNTTTWEQTVRGTQHLGQVQLDSLQMYSNERGRGVMASTSFYAQPTDSDPSKFAGALGTTLTDVTSQVKVERVSATDPTKISEFCQAKFGSFEKGRNYYQLSESEKVQAYKEVIIQDTAKGTFHKGQAVATKALLGIPEFQGTVNIKPGNLGEFKVFIQSTSMNRELVPGTTVVRI